MKTLVLIAAHMRTFSRCLPTQHWHVLRHLPDPTFVVFTVKDRDAESAQELRKLYPKARIEIGAVESQPELPIPVPPTAADWTVGRMYSHEPYAISVHPQAVLRQLWQLEQGAKWAASIGINLEDFDLHLRLRPDSWFRDVIMPRRLRKESHFQITPARSDEVRLGGFKLDPAIRPDECLTPWWGRFGGINDRLALMGPRAAAAYYGTYSRIPELVAAGCPLHPESLVRASLEAAGCYVDDTLWAMFSKLFPLDHPDARLRGTFRDPEILTEDLAHYAGVSR